MSRAELTFTHPVEVTIRAHTRITPQVVTTATVIATDGSIPVAVRKKIGQGQVYYIGTNLGTSIEAGDLGAQDLMRAILMEVIRPPVTGDKVRPRLIECTISSHWTHPVSRNRTHLIS